MKKLFLMGTLGRHQGIKEISMLPPTDLTAFKNIPVHKVIAFKLYGTDGVTSKGLNLVKLHRIRMNNTSFTWAGGHS